ncbi:MAG: FHA domain-containing protein [Lachnospiraceae bacterium]|nr:MAG: FHA domain-containing protein [Lachnospiraceae bacterium]
MNQLKTEYKRDFKNNYMLISFEDEEEADIEKYEFKMLENNYISGLMKFKLVKENEKTIFCYDITSKQSLSRILEYKPIGLEDIKKIVLGIIRAITNMERFLLGTYGLLLNTDYIYADPESLDLALCYLPCIKEEMQSKLSDLFAQILAKIDQNDHEGVVLAYSLYQESLKDNCVFNDLLSIMNKYNKKTKKEILLKIADTDHNKEDVYESDKAKSIESKTKDRAEIFSIKSLFRMKKEKAKVNSPIQESKNSYKKKKKEESPPEEELDEENEEWLELFENSKSTERSNTYEEKEYTHTVLLSEASEDKAGYILKSSDNTVEDIKISYFPFIIGKQERICDYIIKSEMVSRLHLRIDKDRGEKFSIRDLNSLNGTKLEGRLLDNEEVAELSLGNEVEIADLRYVFVKV